jgi:hypothetical protein
MATMTLDELVSQLRKSYGDALQAVVLYGSGAAGEFIPKRSDYNVLVLVRELSLPTLRNAAAVTRAWSEGGNPPPLTMTGAEWRSSADVFPMEYADILERHRVLFGEPPFDGIAVRARDLRLQLEDQAMGKLLQLRQGVLAAGGQPARQRELLAASVSTIMVLFRAVLRLSGTPPPSDTEALARLVGERAGFRSEPFERVVRHVRENGALPDAEVEATLAGYLAGTEALVAHVNALDATP